MNQFVHPSTSHPIVNTGKGSGAENLERSRDAYIDEFDEDYAIVLDRSESQYLDFLQHLTCPFTIRGHID